MINCSVPTALSIEPTTKLFIRPPDLLHEKAVWPYVWTTVTGNNGGRAHIKFAGWETKKENFYTNKKVSNSFVGFSVEKIAQNSDLLVAKIFVSVFLLFFIFYFRMETELGI